MKIGEVRDDVDILKSGLKKVAEGRDEDLTQIEQRLVDEDFSNTLKLIEDTHKLIEDTHKLIEDTDKFIAEYES